ncbi:MAG: SusD/RagB family nutrient-binding outer membrane lipoprotein [Ferruginibacter sp.]
MKKIIILGLIVMTGIASLTGCKKYLDINSDPDTPQFPDPSSVFPTQLAAIPRGLQFDARYAGRYIQNWSTGATSNSNIDLMGYTASSDVNGDIWRQTYFGLGQNLNYIIDNGIKNGQWDYVGAALSLKALMFQYATDYHGPIIFTDAFKENQAFFKYDDQEVVYRGVDSLAKLAITYLNRSDYNPSSSRLSKGDFVYNGSIPKWKKFTFGLLARNAHRITNKATYNAQAVMDYCDSSLSVVDDDFVIPFDALKNDDANFFGTYRNNLTTLRQTNFIVRLLDGSILSGVTATSATAFNRDPRLKHILAASHDTTNGNGGFRGLDPGVADPYVALANWWTYATNSTNWINARKKVAIPFGDTLYVNPSSNVFSSQFRKYLFGDKVVMPIMTASEIQFMKAEAAYKKGNTGVALDAYTKGINLHFDFINRPNFPRGNNVLYTGNPITAAERTAYLNGNDVRRTVATITLSDIMLQKYIALYGWGFFETFVDMRRYHWTADLDPVTNNAVYLGFTLDLTKLAPENLGKPVYRVRPRFNSEYVWNRDELLRIGALNGDYHTYETWFSQP